MGNSISVNFKKIAENAVEPSYANSGDAGLDLTATSKKEIGDNLYKFGFGIALEIPEGYVGLIFPRSSVYKTGSQLTNCVGVIDSGYRGEISAVFHKNRASDISYEVGQRIAQLIIMPRPYVKLISVQKLQKSERGSGSYGSSGL